ncbi:MAG: TonB-dependent receptor [Microscillaceae bacterium]
MLTSIAAQAQGVSGTVKDANGEALVGVSVTVKGTFIGTTTDVNGRFSLKPDFGKGNVVLLFSYVGYKTQELEVSSGQSNIELTLEESTLMADEVIVSASRVEERVLETPVTVESIGIKQLETQPSSEIFSSLSRFKGVDVNQSSFLITVLSTRGFNSAKSERIIQIADGIDYQSPSLNLYAGNIGGIPELDIESVDIIYGANSALYGANAFNGVVVTNSKDPFKYPGLTVSLRGGERSLLDGQLRFAAKIGNRFAFKILASYITANDFIGEDYSPRSQLIVPNNNPAGDGRNLDAIHRHGELALASATTAIGGGATLGDLGFQGTLFSPGFTELDLVGGSDYKATNLRLGGSLHYLITDKIQASVGYRIGQGSGIYQSSNRYAWEKLEFNYAHAEVKSENWFVRWYRNEDKPGDTYDLSFLGTSMQVKPYETPDGSPSPFPNGTTYATAYAQTWIGAFAAARTGGQDVNQAYLTAQASAANVLPVAGDPRFDRLRELGLNDTGAFNPSFNNNSWFNDFSAQYKLPIEQVNIILGGNFRDFTLTSDGTLFSDGDGSPLNADGSTRAVRDEIKNNQWGVYAQISKAFVEERLKFSFAARVDGFKNFDARFSPRASVVYSAGADRQHNFRASYAIAYRQPTMVDQYIFLDIGSILLLGNIGENQAGGFEAISLANAADPLNAPTFRINPLDLERLNSWEVGYKGILFDGFYLDASYYRSNYVDFIGSTRFLGRESGLDPKQALGQPATNPDRTRAMQVWLNADQEVTTQGFQIGIEYYITKSFNIATNYTWSWIEDLPADFIAGFNTPEHKFNFGINGEPYKNLNYNLNVRWQTDYEYFMPFDQGTIESFATLDAQVTYRVPKIYTSFRLGGTNLLDAEAIQVYGSAPIGRIVYLGATFDMNIFKQ